MSKIKLEDITKEQWEEIEKIKQDYIDSQTKQFTFEECKSLVDDMYEKMGLKTPITVLVDSPMAIQIAKKILIPDLNLDKVSKPLVYIWYRVYSGYYAGAKVLGVKFDEEKLKIFTNWLDTNSVCDPYEKICFCSRNPIEIKWNDGVLHNEEGPAVLWADGYSMWSIDGVAVNEKIVMSPETQTIEEIHSEQNEEVRRIRIERLGVLRYVKESDSTVLDRRDNYVENTKEILINTKFGIKLITFCPSTGKRFFLSVPDPVKTCEEAQKSIWGNIEVNIIGRT